MGTHYQYGLSIEEVNKVKLPTSLVLPWGEVTVCADRAEYGLIRLDLEEGAAQPLHFCRTRWIVYLIEEGEVAVRHKDREGKSWSHALKRQQVFHAPAGKVHGFCGLTKSVIYGFTTSKPVDEVYLVESPQEGWENFRQLVVTKDWAEGTDRTSDFREKYWGTIESVVSQEVAGKRIFLRAREQSSLEIHCSKVETYYLHSGKIKVGLRVGRGENKSVALSAGEAFDVEPGLMHMRIGIEDSVIVEVSTRDDDRDSHLVEDGRTYQHIER